MADVKISELPAAASVSSPDVVPIVQSGITKRADVSLFGGFPSVLTVRVDPIGNDSTGKFGDLTKPFLTVQGAISAIEAVYDPSHPPYVILIGDTNSSEDITTFVDDITFVGQGRLCKAFNSLTMTDASICEIGIQNVSVGSITANTDSLYIYARGGARLEGDVSNSVGFIRFQCGAADAYISGTFSAPGHEISINGGGWSYNGTVNIDSAGSTVNAIICLLWDVVCQTLNLIDSRVGSSNGAATTTYQDYLLNPALMDFSTLPIAEPTESGKAWIDTTGGFNIVKVHL